MSAFAKSDCKIATAIPVVNFGELLFSRLHQFGPNNDIVTSRDDLGRSVPQSVVKMLINSVIDEVIARQPAIINTHIAYRQQGSIQINFDVIRRMAVTSFIYVWSDPKQIIEWRENDHEREREEENMEDIVLHQSIALESTKIIADILGAGFRSLYNRPDNVLENISKLREVVEHIYIK